ncbi:MAG TPA: alpha/beta hydrolase [Pseudonocardia sp.]|jgi:acetyl esterase/lipase|nr:alpha/beta hydrolase [Pseudonocardia sp.]
MAGWPARASAPSQRAKIAAAALRWGIRPVLNHLTDSTLGVLAGRQLVAGTLALLSPPLPGTRITPVDERGADGRVRGEWVRAEGVADEPSDAEGCLYYLHGSGYAICSPSTHRGITSRLSALTGLPVFSVDYRLAPRYRFPTAALDVERGWRWLTTGYHPAERIVVAGDSAGGHLAIDLCLALLRAGSPLPAAQALLSPVADLTLGLAGHREQLRPDPMISAAAARRLIGIYTRDVDPTDARLAHVLAGGEQLPPTLIHAGGREILAADAHHLARMLQAGGTPCHLRIWPGQLHVFQALVRLVPEAAEALAEVADFLLDALPPTCASRTDDGRADGGAQGRAAGRGRRIGIRRSA